MFGCINFCIPQKKYAPITPSLKLSGVSDGDKFIEKVASDSFRKKPAPQKLFSGLSSKSLFNTSRRAYGVNSAADSSLVNKILNFISFFQLYFASMTCRKLEIIRIWLHMK